MSNTTQKRFDVIWREEDSYRYIDEAAVVYFEEEYQGEYGVTTNEGTDATAIRSIELWLFDKDNFAFTGTVTFYIDEETYRISQKKQTGENDRHIFLGSGQSVNVHLSGGTNTVRILIQASKSGNILTINSYVQNFVEYNAALDAVFYKNVKNCVEKTIEISKTEPRDSLSHAALGSDNISDNPRFESSFCIEEGEGTLLDRLYMWLKRNTTW